jgi:hypothetical protein
MRTRFSFVLIVGCFLLLPACGKKEPADSNTTTTTTTNASSDTASPAAEPSVAPSSTDASALQSSSAPPPAATPTTQPTPTERTDIKATHFTDIQGTYAQSAIADLGKLGILDQTTGAFRPYAPISRREFVRWLFKANNTYAGTDATKVIRVAETGPATFSDVGLSDADFRYIQGLANAGFVIGIDKNHFAPDRLLTREEMLAIEVSADIGGDANSASNGYDLQSALNVSDIDSINPKYRNPLGKPDAGAIMHRAFGNIKQLKPQQQVTRGEAAMALSVVGGGSSTAALTTPK